MGQKQLPLVAMEDVGKREPVGYGFLCFGRVADGRYGYRSDVFWEAQKFCALGFVECCDPASAKTFGGGSGDHVLSGYGGVHLPVLLAVPAFPSLIGVGADDENNGGLAEPFLLIDLDKGLAPVVVGDEDEGPRLKVAGGRGKTTGLEDRVNLLGRDGV